MLGENTKKTKKHTTKHKDTQYKLIVSNLSDLGRPSQPATKQRNKLADWLPQVWIFYRSPLVFVVSPAASANIATKHINKTDQVQDNELEESNETFDLKARRRHGSNKSK